MKSLTIDLESKLKEIEKRFETPKKDLLEEVAEILHLEYEKDLRLLHTSIESNETEDGDLLQLREDLPIYTLKSIYKLCIQYRLRFLDLRHFKGEIPYEVIVKMKKFEKEFGIQIGKCKILAPAELFHLKNKDSDPMLFLDLGNNNFYLLHKWGKEMNFLRFLAAIPFRNIYFFMGTLLLFATALTLLIPVQEFYYRIFLFMYIFMTCCGFSILFCFAYRKNFNEMEWNSKFHS